MQPWIEGLKLGHVTLLEKKLFIKFPLFNKFIILAKKNLTAGKSNVTLLKKTKPTKVFGFFRQKTRFLQSWISYCWRVTRFAPLAFKKKRNLPFELNASLLERRKERFVDCKNRTRMRLTLKKIQTGRSVHKLLLEKCPTWFNLTGAKNPLSTAVTCSCSQRFLSSSFPLKNLSF